MSDKTDRLSPSATYYGSPRLDCGATDRPSNVDQPLAAVMANVEAHLGDVVTGDDDLADIREQAMVLATDKAHDLGLRDEEASALASLALDLLGIKDESTS